MEESETASTSTGKLQDLVVSLTGFERRAETKATELSSNAWGLKERGFMGKLTYELV